MKKKLLFIFMIAVTGFTNFILAHQQSDSYDPLDVSDPIQFYGTYIIYQGKTIQLNEKNLFIDGRFTDKETSKYAFVYKSFNQAVKHLVPGTAAEPMNLYLAPYVYWIDNPDDPSVRVKGTRGVPFGLDINCSWLQIHGMNKDPENVVLACNRGQAEGAVGNFTMLFIDGDGLALNNMTLGNYCNIDLNYPLKLSLSRKKRNSTITQAQLLIVSGDKLEAHNVRFVSRLNLCPMNGGRRTLFDHCHFESTDDALCGTGVYLNCDFDFYGSKPFYNTSETGAVMLNCDFHVHSGPFQYLTKAESPVMLVDCRFHTTNNVFLGWTQDPTDNLRCYQSNVTCNGLPVLMSKNMPEISVDMTGKRILDAYKIIYRGQTIYNTYNLLCGNDGWDPMQIKPQILEAEKTLNRKLTNLPICLLMRPDMSPAKTDIISVEEGKVPAVFNVLAKRFQGYDAPSGPLCWKWDKELVRFSGEAGDVKFKVIGVNQQDETRRTVVSAQTLTGLECASIIESRPVFLPAPSFTKLPVIKKGVSKGTLCVDYVLNLQGRKDQSLITWYRCSDAKGAGVTEVAVSRLNKPEYTYRLQPGDVNHYLMASVAPKHLRCHPGKAQITVYKKKITQKEILDARHYHTDFQSFPTTYQPEIKSGYWTIDGYKPLDTKSFEWIPNIKDNWYYGSGFDAAVGTGLMQADRGARLLYTPVKGGYGDMEIRLKVDPCKRAGQGFGSPTGQYMDICIKFDTKTVLSCLRLTKLIYNPYIGCLIYLLTS